MSRGRPVRADGVALPTSVALSPAERAIVDALMRAWSCGRGEAIRRAIAEAGEREKATPIADVEARTGACARCGDTIASDGSCRHLRETFAAAAAKETP